MASGVQHDAATLVAGAAKSNFTAYGCDVDSLSETGTKTRAGQHWESQRVSRSPGRDTSMKGQSSMVVQTTRLRIPPREDKDVSSLECFSGGGGSCRLNCLGFIASETRHEFHRAGSLASVESAADQW